MYFQLALVCWLLVTVYWENCLQIEKKVVGGSNDCFSICESNLTLGSADAFHCSWIV